MAGMSRRESSQLIDRTAAAMETLLASGVRHVEVRHVLALLGRDVPASAGVAERPPALDPRADPLTGCLPVSAQGGSDDRSEEDDSIPGQEAHRRRAGFVG